MRASINLGIAVVLLLPLLAIQAQQPAQTPRFTAEVKLVNVSFSVRDRDGALLGNLGRDDFRLFEDGVPQETKFFSSEQETPLTLGMVIDRSPSQQGFEEEDTYVALAFLRHVVRPIDQVFITAFAEWTREISPLTASMQQLDRTLHDFNKILARAPRIDPPARHRGSTAVYDAIYWSTKEYIFGHTGRRAIIMVGDGRETASNISLNDAIELLQSRDVIFYGLANTGFEQNRDVEKDMMPRIAQETGGREIKIGSVSLQQAFDEIEQELRAMYSIGYVSTNAARDGKFRQIEIRTPNSSHVVRARPGYFAR